MFNISDNNKLIKKTVSSMFPVFFAVSIAGSMSMLIDTLLAGSLLGQEAIAAVAIGNPLTALFRGILLIAANGSAVSLAISIGRGNKDECSRFYSLGVTSVAVIGFILVLFVILSSSILVNLFGGAGDPVLARQARIYLICSSPMIIGSTFNLYLVRVLGMYGRNKDAFVVTISGATLNILLSILFAKLLPTDIAIAGLGLGTTCGSALQVTMLFIFYKVRKIPLKLRLHRYKLKYILTTYRAGLASAGNNIIDGLMAGVINNVILALFGDSAALSVFTSVKSVVTFGKITGQAAGFTTGPLTGIFYGARDRNAVVKTAMSGIKATVIASILWSVVFVFALPALAKFFDMTGNPEFVAGVLISLVFLPATAITLLMAELYEAVEKTFLGSLIAILPDSAIFPLFMLILVPLMGYTGLWIAFGFNGLSYLLVFAVILMIRNKRLRVTLEDYLCLKKSIREQVPVFDISVLSTQKQVAGLSTEIHDFLNSENTAPRIAYMSALCVEELATDMIYHSNIKSEQETREVMDIKLFADEENIRIILRNIGKPYNPLDFSLDDSFAKVGVKLAQKVATNIEYTYIYKMNIITIDLGKN